MRTELHKLLTRTIVYIVYKVRMWCGGYTWTRVLVGRCATPMHRRPVTISHKEVEVHPRYPAGFL